MKLSNRKIKKLIRESLKRILFESEDRIADLKDQFNLVYQKMSRAKSQEEFDQLNAEAERLDKEINRLTRTMFKEPEEPGEFDFMETEPLQPPMLSRGTEVGAFQDDIDPLDRPAILDVDEVDMYPGGPMTQREKNRRDFIRDSVLGTAGVAYTLGKAAQHSSVDPRLKIASDWFDRSFTDGTWHSMYDYNFKTWTDNALINVDKDFNSMSPDEQLEYILTYLMDYNSEGWNEALIKEFEMLGHRDPGETGEMDVYNQLDKLIKQKIKDHYIPEKIKELRSSGKTKTTTLTNDMIEAATEGYVDEHFDYNGATDVISNGTLDDIELFENNQAVRCTVDFMDMEGLNLSTEDANKLLNAIRAKVDKIMSRLGGP